MKLYVTWEDGDGHKLLIPKEDYDEFIAIESALYDAFRYERNRDSDTYEAENNYYNYLDSFEILEGEEHYVVLKSDLEE
ncbi:hypothetical protein BS46_gp10 [Acinetobacter phage BS46]|nr:hypothetical protein BS46_gp10 [Acinetobacter phage BS46]